MPAAQVEAVGWNEGRRIKQHVPSSRLCAGDPAEIVLDSGEVRLGGIGEQARRAMCVCLKPFVHRRGVHAQIGRDDRNVPGVRPARSCEFADSVDRVVIVKRQKKRAGRSKGVGLADQLQGVARVPSEDDTVLVWGRVEEREDMTASPFHELRREPRCGVVGVRVAEDVGEQQGHVTLDL